MHVRGEEKFPAVMRLKRASDFKRIYRQGRIIEGADLSLYVLKSEHGPRLGIVLPRQWGNAVERNRMKRHLREAFRRNKDLFSEMEVVARPKETCKRLSAAEVVHAFLEAIRAANGGEGNDE